MLVSILRRSLTISKEIPRRLCSSSSFKRPPNSYLIFLMEFKSDSNLKPMKDISAIAGEKWRNMSPEERSPYEEKYRMALQEYYSRKNTLDEPPKKRRYKARKSKEEKELSLKLKVALKEPRERLAEVRKEFRQFQKETGMPKMPLGIIGHYLQDNRQTVTSGIDEWLNLRPEVANEYSYEAQYLNSIRHLGLIKWRTSVLTKNNDDNEKYLRLQKNLRQIQSKIKTIKDKMES